MAETLGHASLEEDIRILTEAAKERAGGAITKEALRDAVSERVYGPPPERAPASAQVSVAPAKPSPASPRGPLPAYAEDIPPEARLRAEELLDLAWHKGLSVAIKQVKKDTPLTMDLFHDAITERLYAEFKKRGILK